jgi:hypothetical protein
MAVKRMGMLGVSVRKMKALTVKMVAVTLIGRGRYNLICFAYVVYDINLLKPSSNFTYDQV